jgi:glutamyl/glutaminyl-tRNA synthetase
MEISHVLRGEEHLTNTPKQVLLYRALGLDAPRFAHFPLMLGKDKKKLSKRTGDTALQDYRDNGYPPEAVLNFLALQGWALDDKTDVFDAATLCASFDLAKASKGGAIFDPDKLLWMAGEYVRMESVERVAERCAPFLAAAGLVDAAAIAAGGGAERARYVAAVALIQERIQLYSQAPERLAWLFAADGSVAFDGKAEEGARKHAAAAATLSAYRAWLAPRIAAALDAAAVREDTKAWVAERGLKIPALFQPLRLALTGDAGGPDLFDLMAVLGAGKTLARIDAGARRLG